MIEKIEEMFVMYIFAMRHHWFIFGSYGLNYQRNESNIEKIYPFKKEGEEYYICREDHECYFDHDKGIFVLQISEKQYSYEAIISRSKWDVVDGIDGKIIVQYIGEKIFYNYISNERWSAVSKIIEEKEKDKITIVCQDNALYVIDENRIWIIIGDFYHYWVDEAKREIKERQKRENEIIFFDRNLEWKYPVNSARFEELIADLVEMDSKVSKVRLLGKSNNSDGGRDLLIFKREYGNENLHKEKLVIGQCKAYKKSVNKSNVTDIRDTIENYEACGFFLAVTSNLTVPLIDNLMNLKSKFETKR